MEAINLKLSASAKVLLEKHLSEIEYEDPITSVQWYESEISMRYDKNGNEISDASGPSWGVGWYSSDQVPIEMIQEIDGIKFVFNQGPISEKLNGKLLDVEDGNYFVKEYR